MFKNSYLICSFFACYNISTLVTYLTTKHICIVFHVSRILTVLSKYSMTSSNNLNFLKNNAKGLQSCKNRIKLIKYFRSKLNHNGFLFLQETHSTIKKENSWVNDFNGSVFFSYGTSNSCGVLIAYLGKTSFVFNKQKLIKLTES